MRIRVGIPMVLLLASIAAGCGQDRYRERTDAIKAHTKQFYSQLEDGRVEAAVRENQEIEAVAAHIGEDIRRRGHEPGANQIDRDWVQYKAANEAAVQNWLALAQYLAIKKQYERAQATYRRILDHYPQGLDQRYAEQARQGLHALRILEAGPEPRP
ncbi:hypothetical protein [Candidatus Nitrospira bockiana]